MKRKVRNLKQDIVPLSALALCKNAKELKQMLQSGLVRTAGIPSQTDFLVAHTTLPNHHTQGCIVCSKRRSKTIETSSKTIETT